MMIIALKSYLAENLYALALTHEQPVGAVHPKPPSSDGYAGGDHGKSQTGQYPTALRSAKL